VTTKKAVEVVGTNVFFCAECKVAIAVGGATTSSASHRVNGAVHQGAKIDVTKAKDFPAYDSASESAQKYLDRVTEFVKGLP
jgi:hypothetical protein